MPIPKKIHYCWFGNNQIPQEQIEWMKSWKKYCPDYEICCWNEENLSLSEFPYAVEALENGKYAFVSDVARLLVIYKEGGIYLDTDVELLKPLDELTCGNGFLAFENTEVRPPLINTGIGFGAAAGQPLIGALLDSYRNIHFLKEDGTPDITACPLRNTALLCEHGLVRKNHWQNIEGIDILPSQYFCPMDWFTQKVDISDETIGFHHFNGNWRSKSDRLKHIYHILRWKVLGVGLDGYRKGK